MDVTTCLRMLKICDTAIAEPLKSIYEKCLHTGRHPRLWKKEIFMQPIKEQPSNFEKLQIHFAPANLWKDF